MTFNFDQVDLSSIVKKFAKKRGLNVMLPQGTAALGQKVTFRQKDRVTLEKAEEYIRLFLETAGYTMYDKGGMLVVTKVDKYNTHNEYPIFINTPPNQLPRQQERIHAIYYLSNLKVPVPGDTTNSINLILNDMLSSSLQEGNVSWLTDTKLNAIIITDRADSIAAAMTIILALDNSGTKEVMQTMALSYVSAAVVAELLNKQIIAAGGNNPQQKVFKPIGQGEANAYFESNTKIVADTRSNTLILIGRENAIDRIQSFVLEYLDVPIESGKSLIHVYDLQYLDSGEMAAILESIVKGNTDPNAQSTAADRPAGPERFFEGVIIKADTFVEIKPKESAATPQAKSTTAIKDTTESGPISIGGNRLIIAAKNVDWLRIKALIEELDKPQMQVIFEILIADITAQNTLMLGSDFRTPDWMDLPKGVSIQAANLTEPVFGTNDVTPPPLNSTPAPDTDSPTTLNSNLLRLYAPNTNQPLFHSIAKNLSTGLNSGAMIVSFKDACSGAIWGVLQALESFGKTKVLAHPHIVTLNNKTGLERIVDIRQGAGSGENTSVGFNIKQKDFEAVYQVALTPRISSIDRLGFKVNIQISRFENISNPSDYTRDERVMDTYVNMKSGDMLVIGGLMKDYIEEDVDETPFLSKIPIINIFFKNHSKSRIKTTLVALIVPIIIQPKFSETVNAFTSAKVGSALDVLREYPNSPAVTRDPINRLFFGVGSESSEELFTIYKDDKPTEEAKRIKELEANRVVDIKDIYKNEQNPLDKGKKK
jgi:general secretion pathway protein D